MIADYNKRCRFEDRFDPPFQFTNKKKKKKQITITVINTGGKKRRIVRRERKTNFPAAR